MAFMLARKWKQQPPRFRSSWMRTFTLSKSMGRSEWPTGHWQTGMRALFQRSSLLICTFKQELKIEVAPRPFPTSGSVSHLILRKPV
jgi:hypothetical protein